MKLAAVTAVTTIGACSSGGYVTVTVDARPAVHDAKALSITLSVAVLISMVLALFLIAVIYGAWGLKDLKPIFASTLFGFTTRAGTCSESRIGRAQSPESSDSGTYFLLNQNTAQQVQATMRFSPSEGNPGFPSATTIA
jgi:hypothetical protein